MTLVLADAFVAPQNTTKKQKQQALKRVRSISFSMR